MDKNLTQKISKRWNKLLKAEVYHKKNKVRKHEQKLIALVLKLRRHKDSHRTISEV